MVLGGGGGAAPPTLPLLDGRQVRAVRLHMTEGGEVRADQMRSVLRVLVGILVGILVGVLVGVLVGEVVLRKLRQIRRVAGQQILSSELHVQLLEVEAAIAVAVRALPQEVQLMGGVGCAASANPAAGGANRR